MTLVRRRTKKLRIGHQEAMVSTCTVERYWRAARCVDVCCFRLVRGWSCMRVSLCPRSLKMQMLAADPVDSAVGCAVAAGVLAEYGRRLASYPPST